MTKTIRKYLVVLLTNIQINHCSKGIEFCPGLGREIFRQYAPNDPEAFILKWNDKLFLRRGAHTTRTNEDRERQILTTVVRYVQADCIDLNLILQEEKPKQHTSTMSKELLLNVITREYSRLKISPVTFEYIVYNRFGDKGFPLTNLEPEELESFIMQLRSL